MKAILSILPSWARYFLQPFLILYYVPLFLLRSLSAPQRNGGAKNHEIVLENWQQAVDTADRCSSYWPLHLSKEGAIEADIWEIDMNDAVAESVEVAMEARSKHASN